MADVSDIVMRECGEHGLCGFCELHDGEGCGELYAEVIPDDAPAVDDAPQADEP